MRNASMMKFRNFTILYRCQNSFPYNILAKAGAL